MRREREFSTMPQTEISWRHHYIPEFYLKKWCCDKGFLVQFSKPHRNIVKPKRRYPRQTGFVDKLYALEGVPAEASPIVEDQFFKPLDGRAATVLHKMEGGTRSFTAAERVAWTQFLMSLMFRHPENVEAMKRRLFDTLVKTSPSAEWRWRRQWQPGEPRTLAEAMRLELGRDPSQVQRRALELVAEISGSENLGTRIARMMWGSIQLPIGIDPLFTSDRPLLRYGSLEDEWCHIMMPIGPRRFFWATNSREMAERIMMQRPETTARFVNEQIVRRAVGFVYAMSDRNLAYVQQNMSKEADPSIAEMVAMLDRRGALQRMRRTFHHPSGRR